MHWACYGPYWAEVRLRALRETGWDWADMDARSPTPLDTLALEWLRETFPRVFRYHDKPLMLGVLQGRDGANPPFSSPRRDPVRPLPLDPPPPLPRRARGRDEAGEPAGRRLIFGGGWPRQPEAAQPLGGALSPSSGSTKTTSLAAGRSDRRRTPTYGDSRTPAACLPAAFLRVADAKALEADSCRALRLRASSGPSRDPCGKCRSHIAHDREHQ